MPWNITTYYNGQLDQCLTYAREKSANKEYDEIFKERQDEKGIKNYTKARYADTGFIKGYEFQSSIDTFEVELVKV